MKQDKNPSNDLQPSRTTFSFWHEMTVRWADIDSMGHVNNAVYFTYFEAIRIEFFRHVYPACFARDGRQAPVVASASCNYRRELRYPATIELGLHIRRVGARSLEFGYGIFPAQDETLIADGHSVAVWVDMDIGAAAPLPDALRRQLANYLVDETD